MRPSLSFHFPSLKTSHNVNEWQVDTFMTLEQAYNILTPFDKNWFIRA
jgi:hypothetical protein